MSDLIYPALTTWGFVAGVSFYRLVQSERRDRFGRFNEGVIHAVISAGCMVVFALSWPLWVLPWAMLKLVKKEEA
jgi:hypothetical protein